MAKKLIFPLLILLLIAAVLLSLSLGAMRIPLSDVLRLMAGKPGVSASYHTVFFLVRLPRLLLGVLVGAALGISGAAIQAVFRNPLAEPGLVGISSGASLLAVLVIAMDETWLAALSDLAGYYLIAFAAFGGALLTATLVYRLSKKGSRALVGTMLLAGIAINALAAALTGLITANAQEQQLRSITFWMLGSLAGANWTILICVAPLILITLFLLPGYGRKLNAFTLGEKQAATLGIRTARVKQQVILLVTLAVGASVAVSGIIGFVGLLVPHLVRLLGGPDNRYVLPASALTGALVLTLADLGARTLTAPIEQPIGVVTALIGAPLFLYLLIRDKKKIPD